MVPPNYVKIFVSQIFTGFKKKLEPQLKLFKNLIFGGPFRGFRNEVVPTNYVKYLSLKYLLISKKTSTLT